MTQPCVSHFRVGLLDLDLNFHMNNGRFFSVMDLGRLDLMMRTGHFGKLLKKGYFPVILSEAMVFRKSLNFLERYELHTQIEGWDKNFYYISQKFYLKDKLVASATVRGCFKKRGRIGVVPVAELFALIGEELDQKPLDNLIEQQIKLDNLLLPRSK